MNHSPNEVGSVEVVAENVSVPSVTVSSTPPSRPAGPLMTPPSAPSPGTSSTSSSTGLPSSVGVTRKDCRSKPGLEKLTSYERRNGTSSMVQVPSGDEPAMTEIVARPVVSRDPVYVPYRADQNLPPVAIWPSSTSPTLAPTPNATASSDRPPRSTAGRPRKPAATVVDAATAPSGSSREDTNGVSVTTTSPSLPVSPALTLPRNTVEVGAAAASGSVPGALPGVPPAPSPLPSAPVPVPPSAPVPVSPPGLSGRPSPFRSAAVAAGAALLSLRNSQNAAPPSTPAHNDSSTIAATKPRRPRARIGRSRNTTRVYAGTAEPLPSMLTMCWRSLPNQ